MAFAFLPWRVRTGAREELLGWGVTTRPEPQQYFLIHSSLLGTSSRLPRAAVIVG